MLSTAAESVPSRSQHFSKVIDLPKTAESRLTMELPKGPRDYVIGTKQIFFRKDEAVVDLDCETLVDEELNEDEKNFMVKIRQDLRDELGAKMDWS